MTYQKKASEWHIWGSTEGEKYWSLKNSLTWEEVSSRGGADEEVIDSAEPVSETDTVWDEHTVVRPGRSQAETAKRLKPGNKCPRSMG